MKRAELLKKLKDTAKNNGLKLEFIREGANHSLYRIGNWEFPVARHTEINENTARDTIKRAEKEKK